MDGKTIRLSIHGLSHTYMLPTNVDRQTMAMLNVLYMKWGKGLSGHGGNDVAPRASIHACQVTNRLQLHCECDVMHAVQCQQLDRMHYVAS